jgi:hypothetical protein
MRPKTEDSTGMGTVHEILALRKNMVWFSSVGLGYVALNCSIECAYNRFTRHVCKAIARNNLISYCLSVCVFPHGITLLPPKGHACKLIVGILIVICQYIPILIKI